MRIISPSRRARGVAVFATVALALTACAERDEKSATRSDGEGVAFGASMEEYQAAFEEIDEITLNTQSPAPEGSPVGKNFEDYFAAVEEWSGGKIKFNVTFANAVAPAPEVDEAIADGRLDLGSVMAGYEPDTYPAYAALSDTSFMGNGSPLEMIMTPHGYISEIAVGNEQVQEEFAARDLTILAPAFTGGINGIYCGKELRTAADLKGAQVRISGAAHSAEAKAMGMTPVSLAYEEIYEALQRGVLDCAFAGITVVSLADLLSVSPHAILDRNTHFGQVPSALSVNTEVYEGLPLVAQQLLYDRSDVFIESNMEGLVGMYRDVLGEVEGKGGSIAGLDEASQAALDEGNDEFLDAVAKNSAITDGAGLVEQIRSTSDAWRAKVGELDYDVEVDYADFSAWAQDNEVDFEPFMDEVRTTLSANRPS